MIITFPECKECIINQIHDIIEFNNIADSLAQELLDEVRPIIDQADLSKISAPMLTKIAHQVIRKKTGINDLYGKVRLIENQKAKEIVAGLPQPQGEEALSKYIQYSITGNVMDYGTLARFDVEETLKKIDEHPFNQESYLFFKEQLEKPKKILYIGDNTGEIFFDKFFIEYLLSEGHQVTFAYKAEPALNDVLLDDVKYAEIDKLCPIINSGSTTAGTIWEEMTDEMKKAYNNSDLIISKGQGNFETLPRDKTLTFFLLKMKCKYLAENQNLKFGAFILEYWPKTTT